MNGHHQSNTNLATLIGLLAIIVGTVFFLHHRESMSSAMASSMASDGMTQSALTYLFIAFVIHTLYGAFIALTAIVTGLWPALQVVGGEITAAFRAVMAERTARSRAAVAQYTAAAAPESQQPKDDPLTAAIKTLDKNLRRVAEKVESVKASTEQLSNRMTDVESDIASVTTEAAKPKTTRTRTAKA